MEKHCAPFCYGIWPFLVAPLLLLVPLLAMQWQEIETLVAANAKRALEPESSWATAETYNRGRDVLLTGTAPDQATVDEALRTTASAEGVRTVNFVGDIVPPPIEPSPPELTVSFDGEQITLSGKLDSQARIDQVMAEAANRFGASNVRNALMPGDHLTALPDLSSAFAAVTQVDSEPKLSFSNGTLTIGGIVTSDERRTALEQLVSARYTGDLNNQIQVIAPPCQLAIKDLLDGSKINFASGSASISPASDELLAQIAVAATDCQDAEFEVSGHTDAIGSEQDNQALSEQRAQAVVDKLAELGLNPERFNAVGFGSARPLGDNDAVAGRAANRRIEFRVTN